MKRTFNFRYAVMFTLSYALGIAAFYVCENSLKIIGILMIFMPVVTGAFVLLFKGKDFYKTAIVSLSALIVLLAGFFNVKIRYDDFFIGVNAEDFTVTAVFDRDEYSQNFGHVYYFTNAKMTSSAGTYGNEKIVVYSDSAAAFSYGDKVTFKGNFSSVEKYSSISSYYFSSGIKFRGNSDFYGAEVSGRKFAVFGYIRRALERAIDRGMENRNAAVAKAMIFGNKTELSLEVASGMQAAGLAHLFAVSGLHVGIISGAVYAFLKRLNAGRWIRCIVPIAVSFVYCGVCGFSPSSLRALLMFSISVVLATKGYKPDMLNVVFASAAILLVVRPQYLFSYGFLLSYSAVVSIVVMRKPVSDLLGFIKGPVRNNIATVVSAQLGVIPLSAAFFGTLSLVAIPINILFVPIISLIFLIVLLGVLLSGITTLSGVFMFIPNLIIGLIVRFVTGTDLGFFMIPAEATAVTAGIYFIGLLLASEVFNFRSGVKIAVFFSALLISIIFSQLFVYGIL